MRHEYCMKQTKYKVGDYIVITGFAEPQLIGRTARVHLIDHDHYMLDLLDYPCSYYPIWSIAKADANSYLNITMTVLYAAR